MLFSNSYHQPNPIGTGFNIPLPGRPADPANDAPDDNQADSHRDNRPFIRVSVAGVNQKCNNGRGKDAPACYDIEQAFCDCAACRVAMASKSA